MYKPTLEKPFRIVKNIRLLSSGDWVWTIHVWWRSSKQADLTLEPSKSFNQYSEAMNECRRVAKLFDVKCVEV